MQEKKNQAVRGVENVKIVPNHDPCETYFRIDEEINN
jgi:hypothetical protein